MLKTTIASQETGAASGVNQEGHSPTRKCVLTASLTEEAPMPSSGLLLSPANPKTASNGTAVPLSPLDTLPTFVPSSMPSSPKDHVPGSPLDPRPPTTPPSPRSLAASSAQDFSPSSGTVLSAPQGISVLERLIKTCPVWLLLGIAPERAKLILQREAPGIFLVRKNPLMKRMVLSVRLCDQEGEPQVQDLLIKEEKSLIYLEGSVLVFDDIFKLIAFYCVSRDILPFKLKLPRAVVHATKHEDMEMISGLGSEFWGSSLNRCPEVGNASGGLHSNHYQSPGGVEPYTEDHRLWYVNPVFVEEHCSSLAEPLLISRSQSLTTPGQALPRYKRPPPLPPRPLSLDESPLAHKPVRGRAPEPPASVVPRCAPNLPPQAPVGRAAAEEQGAAVQPQGQRRNPPVPPRRRPSEKQLEEQVAAAREEGGKDSAVPVATLVCLDDAAYADCHPPGEAFPKMLRPTRPARPAAPAGGTIAPPSAQPVPPPRKKRQSQIMPPAVAVSKVGEVSQAPLEVPSENSCHESSSTPTVTCYRVSGVEHQGSDVSLYSPEGGATQLDPDSYSTSSTEEEGDAPAGAVAPAKRSSAVMLDRAKQRISMVNLSHILTSFMSADRKLKKRIVELAQDRDSYFGNLVRDYRSFTLETMEKHSSSTEMLQEIRLMMTQLKNYLIQSAELKALLEPVVHPEEKLEAIIEAALCKSVLKPLYEAVCSRLRHMHSQDGSLERLREHQRVLLNTTTTDLGVTTSVPEAPAMEKIQLKMASLNKEYSPEKKVTILLKTCKIIYDSMSVSSPGKLHGADDFLPVLMYVLVRSNMAALLLDVEYMMELMDPALQLGEGSYYLTTTYGALEHIKNYDKLEVTGQLSLEIQDSIHRWERRRTLNKARGSRSAVQDFINVSFLEAGSNTKTLGAHPDTTTLDLCNQCAKKFDVLEPESYSLFVLVDGHYRLLAQDELPLSVKSSLHHSEPRKDYYFVYRPGSLGKEMAAPQPVSSSDALI